MNRTQPTRQSTISNEMKNSKSGSMDISYIRVHHSWQAFIKYCESIGFGEIEKLKIQDGLPIIAEEVRRKIKFL